MKKFWSNKKLRLSVLLVFALILFYLFVVQVTNGKNTKLGSFNAVKPTRQSVDLDSKIEKIKKIDTIQASEKTVAPTNPGVFVTDFSPDNSKGLGLQSEK